MTYRTGIRRSIQIIVALIVGALLLGAITSNPAPASHEHPPPSAEITYSLSDLGRTEATRVILLKAGGPQPTEPTTLVDASGTLVVTASPVVGECKEDKELTTGLGTDEWCIKLENIATGQPIVGALGGGDSTVVLTIEAKHRLRWPLLAVGVFFLAAVVVVILTTFALPRFVYWAQLKWASRKRDNDTVKGVKDWVAKAQANRLSSAEIVSRLEWAREHGAEKVRTDRTNLAAELRAASKLHEAPLHEEAEAEKEKGKLVHIDQVLTASGDVATSDAASLLAAYRSAVKTYEQFDRTSKTLVEGIEDEDIKATAQLHRDDGLRRHANYLARATKTEWEKQLAELLSQILDLRAADRGTRALIAPDDQSERSHDLLAVQTEVSRGVAIFAVVGASAATLVLAAVLMAIATATVLAGTYMPNNTFGTKTDYIALAIATLGSAGAVGVVTLLLRLRLPNSWNA